MSTPFDGAAGLLPRLRFSRTGRRSGLENDSGAVTQNFGCAGSTAEFGGVVPEAKDGVGTDGLGVIDHEFVGLLSRLLTHICVCTDASANDGLEPAEDPLGDGGRADDDAPNDATILFDPVAFDGEGGGDRDGHGWRIVRGVTRIQVLSPGC